jgi:hypothetical protein
MTIGPVQLLVIGFNEADFHGHIRAELDRLRASDTIRLIDVAFVAKDSDGNLTRMRMSDLSTEESEEFGAVVGALIGLGAGGEEGPRLVRLPVPRQARRATCCRTTSGTSRTRWAMPRPPRSR